MNRAQLQERNKKVVELVKIGMSAKKAKKTYVHTYVAALFNLTERQIRNILKEAQQTQNAQEAQQ